MSSIVLDACAPKIPDTRRDNTVDNYFGTQVADPYRWLEDDASDETAQWVQAQNKVTNHYLKGIPGRKQLLNRLLDVANYEKVGLPALKKNGKWYYFCNNGLQNQSVLYELDSPQSEPRVFLDPNTLSDDGTVALKGTFFSHDGKYMAYTISRSGSDWEEIFVIETATGKQLDDHIEWAKFTEAAWRGDGFYYSAYDKPTDEHAYSGKNEGHKIYYHKIGTTQSQDVLFYQNLKEPLRFYQASVNQEETMLFLYEDGADIGNNLYVMDLRPDAKNKGFVQITKDMKNTCIQAETDGDMIYLYTNVDAPLNKLVVTNISNPREWKDVIPEGKSVLDEVSFIADDFIIALYSQDASTHAYLYDRNDGRMVEELKLPGVGSASFSTKIHEPWCYYSYSSFTTPGTIYEWNIETGNSTVYKQPKTSFDLSDFETVQVFFNSKDGTRIPMFLTYRKGIKLDGNNPVYLYGYGGFNISLPPSFSSTRIPFLESGGIYAQVNLRGGSEYGEAWHLAGTKMQKQNVFDDFISAAEWLIAQGYTSTSKLAIVGGSNGGLLVGACMTQRPDLFAVAIPEVGVMDMLRYHKFTIGWNWAPDYGTSEDSEEMFRYLYGYSPLHNLKPGTVYPATLVITADHDDRVVPAHSFKFAATLQACNAGPNPTLIRIDTKAGHGGGKPLKKALEEQADIYAFIMHNLK
ncbi:MAG: S9 family peptidase [Bacteroidaceae bacterium]|nr:S9 family peptidase [Bacteroidaceae bacterium]